MWDATVFQFNSWTQNHSQGSINTAIHQGQVDVQQELLLQLGTALHVSTLCPPNITTCNQISRAFLFFCISKKTGGWEWPGNEANFERQLIIGNTVCEVHCP